MSIIISKEGALIMLSESLSGRVQHLKLLYLLHPQNPRRHLFRNVRLLRQQRNMKLPLRHLLSIRRRTPRRLRLRILFISNMPQPVPTPNLRVRNRHPLNFLLVLQLIMIMIRPIAKDPHLVYPGVRHRNSYSSLRQWNHIRLSLPRLVLLALRRHLRTFKTRRMSRNLPLSTELGN